MTPPTAILTEKPEAGGRGGGFAGGRDGFGDDGGRFGGGFRGRPREVALRTYMTGMGLALGGITMVFAAFTSAYIVRRGMSNDWQPTEIHALLWWNSLVLVGSSLTLERARRFLRSGLRAAFRAWWSVTVALGLAFLAGQIAVWRQLAAEGVYLASNPSSSFFYLLTGAHGIHLLGGVLALLYVLFRVRRPGVMSRIPVEVTALYWHFMDGLWVYLFMVLLYWR